MTKSYDALVVGAGIGGIRAALDLASQGQKVALIEKKHNVGGLLVQLEHQFPTDHCGMCKMLPLTERDMSSQFCMRKGLFHRNIDILLGTELVSLEGDPGQFQAVVRQSSSLVDPTRCIGCGLCSEVCPVRVDDEFNSGLTKRAAIHLPVPQAVPNHYTVDLDNCARCWKCYQACPTKAVDFKFEERQGFAIQVVSDDKDRSESLADRIQNEDFPATTMATPAEAIDQLASGGEVNLVFLDADMAEGAAERAIERLLEMRPGLQVVVFGSDAEKLRALVEAGARESLPELGDAAFSAWLDKLYMRIVSAVRMELTTAAVILAPGFECYDPTGLGDTLGYGVFPDVVTSLEFERLLSSTGPAREKLTRPSDGKPLRKIAWLQCVGSRDLKKKADYCSSICCMISLKEAGLAVKQARQRGMELDTAIFAMDMRTFGKGHQAYLDHEQEDNGLRIVRARIHSVIPNPGPEGGLLAKYVHEAGVVEEEQFDMLVLAVGARPSASMGALARAAGVETNQWGFIESEPFKPSRTSRLGVFSAGSAAGPRDIAESVIQSDAAALEASRLINIYAPLREKAPEPEPEYRDTSREPSRLLVAVCGSCPTLGKSLNTDRFVSELSEFPSVGEVAIIHGACTEKGWDEIRETAERMRPNRVLIAACMPYSYVPRLHELAGRINLHPALMDVVDIHTPLVEDKPGEFKESEALSRVRMAAMKLMGVETPAKAGTRPVEPKALVVGGGLAGMTAAVGIADHGYEVHLVEETDELGGAAMKVRRTLSGADPVKFMEDLIERVEKHPNIRVHKDARVTLSSGTSGSFLSILDTVNGPMHLSHATTVLATGGREAKVFDWGFKVQKSVMTQQELETKLADGVLDPRELTSVVMIQCLRSREEDRNYCSRVCCQQALKNALLLKQRNPEVNVYVLHRDMMVYGFAEAAYTEARRAGVIFIRFDPAAKPTVTFDESKPAKPIVHVHDDVLGGDVEIHADLLAISSGVEPGETAEMAELFGIEVDGDGFFQEAEPKWRPVDFLHQGLFMCGLARAPGTMDETIATAKAAAVRALSILSEKHLAMPNTVAVVRQSLCSLCGKCVEVCPYGARTMDLEMEKIVIDPLLCQACGSCSAACPNGAAELRGFSDFQAMNMIDAALEDFRLEPQGEME